MKLPKNSPARVHAVLVTLSGLAVVYQESSKEGLVIALLGIGGGVVQRENGKALSALLEPSPYDQQSEAGRLLRAALQHVPSYNEDRCALPGVGAFRRYSGFPCSPSHVLLVTLRTACFPSTPLISHRCLVLK